MKLLVLLSVFFIGINLKAQLQKTTFEQLDSLEKIQNKYIIVFIHTDWCKYCHKMNNVTFKDLGLLNKINQDFYFVSFNAEEKSEIKFKGSNFYFKPNGENLGIHSLALKLATINGRVSYPSLVILDKNQEVIDVYNQYISAKDLNTALSKLYKH